MKKYIMVALLLGALIIPSFIFAQENTDTSSTSTCLSLVNKLTYRSRDISTNDEVSALQDFLHAEGYLNSAPTGYFGLITLQAVKDFQKANGINAVGYVGTLTRAKINQLSCESNTSSPTTTLTPTNKTVVTPNVNINTTSLTPSSVATMPTQPIYNNSTSVCALGALYNSITGQLCSSINQPSMPNLPEGCTSTKGFSPTTGQACNGVATAVQQIQQTVQQIPNTQQIAQNTTLPTVVTPTPTSESSQSVGEQITVNISADPKEVKWGYGTMLTWVSKNATYCVPSGGPSESNWPNYSQNASYSYYTGQLYKTTTYSLTCHNSAGQSGSNSITFNIDQPAGNASGSLSSDSTSCIVAENSNQCQVELWWNMQNAAAPHLMNRNLGNALSNEANISNINPLSVTVNYPQTTFDLKNGNDLIDTKTITASCATGTVWNMNLCRR